MKKLLFSLSILISLTCFLSKGWGMPLCKGDKDDYRHNCFETYTFKNGKYIGEYNNQNKPHGYGKYYFSKGDIYEGYFQNNAMHGKGKFISKEADYIYEGWFASDKFNGRGTIRYKNGDSYEGNFLNGIKHDEKGLYIYSNGRREIKKWVKGQPKCGNLFGIPVECIQDTFKFRNDENTKFIPY